MPREPKYTTLKLNALSKEEFIQILDKYILNRQDYSIPGNGIDSKAIIGKEITQREKIWKKAHKENNNPVY